MKADMEEVLYNANVDLVVGGHVHAYERNVSLIMFLTFLSTHSYSSASG